MNLSRSGVLLRANQAPEVGTEVEMFVALSRGPGARWDVADIICMGRVVRTDRECGDGETWLIATTIDAYSLIPSRD